MMSDVQFVVVFRGNGGSSSSPQQEIKRRAVVRAVKQKRRIGI